MRKAHPAGRSTRQLVEDAPVDLAQALLTAEGLEGETRIELQSNPNEDPVVDRREALLGSLAKLDGELLGFVEERCRRVLGLSEGKGTSSLDTIAEQDLSEEALEAYNAQPDALCRSIWTYTRRREVFDDAESFHVARRYRDYERLYNAFEVDLEEVLDTNSGSIDSKRLGTAMTDVLGLKTPCTVRAIDLPATEPYPPSVMIIVRHGGPLSSVHDHRSDGQRKTIYFRPANEATLIYTPEQKKIEVCSDSRPVRDAVARCFAEVVLNHDVSAKPLTWKFYDLSRFRNSLRLSASNVEGFEVTSAQVVEVTVQLDSASRYLTLKVAIDDDIDEIAARYLGPHSALHRSDRITRIRIAVRYHRIGDAKDRTLSITVTDTGSCNVQSMRDPEERRLGFGLLDSWQVMQAFKPIAVADLRAQFPNLVRLYERIGDDVPASLLREFRLDPKQLMTMGLLERSGRDERVLIDGGAQEGEANVGHGRDLTAVSLTDTFGQDAGTMPSDLFTRYQLNARWLLETIVSLMKPLLARHSGVVLDEDLIALGMMDINGQNVPVYFARRLDQPKTLNRLDLLLRGQHTSGVGLILSGSAQPPQWLGANVVVPLLTNVVHGGSTSVLSRESIVFEFSAGRNLATGGTKPTVQRNGSHGGTLHIPGKDPLTLAGNDQITICERLVAAHNAGAPDVHVKELMTGLGSASPKPAFATKTRASIFGAYIAKGAKRGFWRLKVNAGSI